MRDRSPARCNIAQILPGRIHELRAIVDRVQASAGLPLPPDPELDTLEAEKALLMEHASGRYTLQRLQPVAEEVATRALRMVEIDEPDMIRTIALGALQSRATPRRN